MGFGKLIGKILGGSGANLVESIGSVADKFITTPSEKKAFELEIQKAAFEHEARLRDQMIDAFDSEVEDRKSARDMFRADSRLQKLYAIIFLIAYISLTGIILYGIYVSRTGGLTYEDYEIGFISTLFGAMSTKVSTITDFLFGGSIKSKQDEHPKAV